MYSCKKTIKSNPELYLTVDHKEFCDAAQVRERLDLETDLKSMGIRWVNWEIEHKDQFYYVYSINNKYLDIVSHLYDTYPSLNVISSEEVTRISKCRGRYASFKGVL